MTLPPGSTMSMPSWIVVAVPLPLTCGFTSTDGRAAADDDHTRITPSETRRIARGLWFMAPPSRRHRGNRNARPYAHEFTALALVVVRCKTVVENRSAAPGAGVECADDDRARRFAR